MEFSVCELCCLCGLIEHVWFREVVLLFRCSINLLKLDEMILLFRNLPRHQFGNLQSKMFPAYFSILSICLAVCVVTFAYMHPWKSSSYLERYQLGFLLSSFGFNLSNMLVFTPMTVEVDS